jgi:hypothetical protein
VPRAKDTIGFRAEVAGDRPPARLDRPLEDAPIDLNALIEPRIGAVTAVLGILLVVALILLAVVARRVSRLQKRLAALTRDERGHSLESILEGHLERVLSVDREVDALAVRTAALETNGRRALQRFGLVRYNPFEETGGNQSFALALLDADEHGFIITSLHARSGTRIYARALTGGRAEGPLSDEETEALRLARASASGPPMIADRARVTARGA